MSHVMRALRTPHGFARVSLVALAFLWVIVPSGAVVRLTASGLGCPDWPLCDGSVVPETAFHAWIEYTNRVLSAVVGVVAVGTWVIARKIADGPRSLRVWAALAAAATVAQMPLGAVTVLSGLDPRAVGAHFLLSMVALAFGTMLALTAFDRRAGRTRRWERRRGVMAGGVVLTAAVVLSSGVAVTMAGPHSGDDDVTHRVGDLVLAIDVHVRAAIGLIVLAAVLAAWVWREGGVDRATARLAALAVGLIVLQIAIGEYQYRNGLPWQVVVAHVSTAALVWAVIVAACRGVARPPVGEGYRRREAALWQGTQRTESGSTLSRPSGISAPQSTQIP